MKKLLPLLTISGSILFSGCNSFVKQNTSDELPPVRKAIAAPYLNGAMTLDGKLEEQNWKNAGYFDDFIPFRKKKMPDSKTEVRVFHDGTYLYIGMKCHDKRADVKPIAKGGYLWSGDCIELFLGGMIPEQNLYQLCWGSGEARFGENPNWEQKSMIFDDYWTTETRIKLSMLQACIHNSTLSFHLARMVPKSKTYVIWQYVGNDFQNLPRYSELILGSYDLAAQLKFFYFSDKKLTRQEYEQLNAKLAVPPEMIEYGPWLFSASETEMNIGWFNHGKTGAYLEYRKKGETKFKRIRSHFRNDGWDRDQKLHKVQLKGLEKGTVYEYRIVNTTDVYTPGVTFPKDGTLFTFTTHGKKDLTMGIFTDVHNNGHSLKPLLENKKLMDSCDILVNVGDMLSNGTGIRSIFTGYLESQLVFATKKPLLNFRGNHEYVGCSPNSFFDVFGTPDFKGYSINRFGDVCIIGLDNVNSDQKEWLRKAIKTPEFQTAKHRILFAHYPPTRKNTYYAKGILRYLDGIFTGKNPEATIDLMICGHIHSGSFTAKNSGLTVPLNPARKPFKAENVPFDVFVHSGMGNKDNVMTLVEAKGDSLTVKLIRMDGSVSREFKIK